MTKKDGGKSKGEKDLKAGVEKGGRSDKKEEKVLGESIIIQRGRRERTQNFTFPVTLTCGLRYPGGSQPSYVLSVLTMRNTASFARRDAAGSKGKRVRGRGRRGQRMGAIFCDRQCSARYGCRRFLSRGNAAASRMFSSPRSFSTTRSIPRPKPPCGGRPYLCMVR